MITLDDTTFVATISAADTPVLVDFYADWCGPCKALVPLLEDLERRYAGELTVVKVNADTAPGAATRCGVRGLPTLVLFKDGQPAAQHTGAIGKGQLSSWVAGAL